jgi:aminoglycoside phosphotransferase (APT) family kinase protein
MTQVENAVHDQLLQMYRRRHPTYELLEISHLMRENTGWESELYSFTLRYQEEQILQAKPTILKMYRGKSGTKKAIGEFYGMQQLWHYQYPVPHVQQLMLDDSLFGASCVLMEKVTGQSMYGIMQQISLQDGAPLIGRFCELLVDLHALDWEAFVLDPSQYASAVLVGRKLAATRLFIEQTVPDLFEPVLVWLQARSQHLTQIAPSVVHGDFHPENVLLNEQGEVSVIDWTQIEVSDFRFDLAWTLTIVNAFLGPEWRDMTLSEYEYLTQQQVADLDFFEVFACLKRLFDIVACLYQDNGEVLGMHSDAKLAMQRNRESTHTIYAQLCLRTGREYPELLRVL